MLKEHRAVFLKLVCVIFVSGEVIAVVGSCETLGSWCHQKAVTLQPAEEDGYVSHAILYLAFNLIMVYLDTLLYIVLFCLFCLVSTLWRTTVLVPRGAETKYRYFKGFFLESKVRQDGFPSNQLRHTIALRGSRKFSF